jgi:hypothetical protein
VVDLPNPLRGATLQVVYDILNVRGFDVYRVKRGGKNQMAIVQLKRRSDGATDSYAGVTNGLAVRYACRCVLSGYADKAMDRDKAKNG